MRQAPLLRLFIAHDAVHDRWVVLLLLHHLACDHTTLEVVQEEIQAHLLGRAEGLPAPLPFRNFVAQARLGVSREEHEAFFREMLGDVDEPTAPFGLTDVQGDGAGISEGRRAMDPALAKRLRARARALGVSAASLFHLAWAQVLARVSGRDDVVFGTVLFGRMQGGEGADRALGMFINTLPVRIRIGEDAVADSVRRTHALLAELLRHEHASLALAQRCSAVAPPAPLFAALLNYRHSAAPGDAVGGGPPGLGRNRLSGRRGAHQLSVHAFGGRSGRRLRADGAGAIADRSGSHLRLHADSAREARRGAGAARRRRRCGASTCCRQPSGIRLLVEWNATEADYPRDKCVHELFEAQAARTPDAIAVVHEDAQLTYAELNAKANRLAHHLRSAGGGPGRAGGDRA